MAKFKVEVELDWLGEEMNIDETLKEEILASITDQITNNATKEITLKLNKLIEERTSEIIDKYLDKTFENTIENMKMPYKTSSWDSKYEMIPLSEFIGKKYEAHLNKKVFDKDGRTPSYDRDKTLSISEYFINNYLEKELTAKVSKLIQTARQDAEETIVKTLEYNLKEQLSVDIIKRLNIPKILESLQDKAELIEAKGEK